MGQCAGCQRKQKRGKSSKYWQQPSDTGQFAQKKLKKLRFQGIVSNLKIKNCGYVQLKNTQDRLSVKVDVEDIESFLLKEKLRNRNNVLFWTFEHKFGLQMNEYELRKSFITLTFLNEDNQSVGKTIVNLYLIITGPYHQDYAVKMKKGENTRVSFDMKISQIIQISLKSLRTDINLTKKHPGQKFSYSIKTIIGNNTGLNMSQPSFTVRVCLDNKQEIELSQQHIKLKKRNSIVRLPSKQIPAENDLQWVPDFMHQMPSIVMKTLVSEIHHSYFQILLWKIKDNCQNQEQNETLELFGQCYIALHKLFSIDPIDTEQEDGRVIQTREICWTEKMWHHGREIGHGQFKFTVTNDKYKRQMPVMVQTQAGVMVYSPIYFDNTEKSQSNELKELNKLILQIQNNVVKLDNREVSGLHARRIKIEIEGQLQSLVELLNKSTKQSIICYSYSSENQFIDAQQILISLGMEMMSWLEQEDELINELCWEILVALLRRGQFLLAHLRFDSNEEIESKSTKKIKTKIEVGLLYQEFLYKQLSLALKSLNVKGLDIQRKFAEIFCSYAYFRIPEFRNKFLEAIEKSDDPQIYEWRGIEFQLDSDINYKVLNEQFNTFTLLCDWDHSFYRCLQPETQSQQNKAELQNILIDNEWKNRFAKRGTAFFSFIVYWVEYIESIVIRVKEIQWKYFPGYNRIVKCFLVELKKRPLLEYPDSLKLACFKLVTNQKLLNAMVMILFSKTNLHDAIVVFKTIQFIHEMLDYLKKNKKKIPPTFNYNQFYKITKIILENQSSFVVSKILILLYTHFEIFSHEFRRKISLLLLGKLFFKLFLHWSFNVREIFCHFIVYRILYENFQAEPHSCADILIQEEFVEDIRLKYFRSIAQIQQAITQKRKQSMQNFTISYEKNLYKSMKKKLRKKKAQKNLDETNPNINEQIKRPEPTTPNLHHQFLHSDFQYKSSLLKQNPIIKTERSQSQILDHRLVFPALKNKTNHLEEINHIKASKYNFKCEVYDTTKGSRRSIMGKANKNIRNDLKQDFELSKIEEQQKEYLERALNKLKKVEENSKKIRLSQKQTSYIPLMHIEMPVDSKQIRPDSMDDW